MLGFGNLPLLSELIVQYFETFISSAFWWNYDMVIEKMYHKDVQTYLWWCRLIYFHSRGHRKDLKISTVGSCTGACSFLTGHYGWPGMLGNTHLIMVELKECLSQSKSSCLRKCWQKIYDNGWTQRSACQRVDADIW